MPAAPQGVGRRARVGRWTRLALCFLLAGLNAAPAPARAATAADLVPRGAGLPWGSGLPWPSGVSISSRDTKAFEAWRGRPLDLETVFFGTKTWRHMITSTTALRSKLPTVPGRLIVALGMVPADHSGRLAECAAGQFDVHIQAVSAGMLVHGGAAAAAVGKPLLLRLGWEANAVDSGFPWYIVGDGAEWRDCFRRWIDILNPVTDPATSPPTRRKNFVIVWNMANRGSFPHPIDNAWPGDDYVDIVASQYYDRCPPLPEGNDAEWARRLSASDAHGNPAGPLAWLNYARSKNKPYAIPEWGIGGPNDVCARPGIDNPHFIRKMHEFFQAHADDIAFEAYFNAHGFADDTKGTHKLFAPEPAHPDATMPDHQAYAQRYNPLAADAYRELWGREATPEPAQLSVAGPAQAGAEGDDGATPFAFTVSRTGNLDRELTVKWRVSGDVSGEDFAGGVLPSGTLTLAAEETAQTITVMVRGDLEEEPDEVFEVTLSQPSDGATVGTASATASVLNDDVEPPVLAVAAIVASRPEGASGPAAFTFAITRTGDVRRQVSVRWGVTMGEADAGDFSGSTTGSVTFGVGETRKTVTVRVAGDTDVEPDEAFAVALSSPSAGASIGPGSAVATISNDDFEPSVLSVAAVDAATSEGNSGTSGLTFRVSRSGDVSRAVGVRWQVGGSGVDGADFPGGVLPSGTVNLAPEENATTVNVPIQGDARVELDEAFVVTLSDPTGDARLGTTTAVGTILNDDAEPAVLSLVALDAVKGEGQHGLVPFTFKVVRSGDSRRAVSAAWSVAGIGAGADDLDRAVLPSGTVWLNRGEMSRTLTVRVRGDRGVEPDESFTMTLSTPTVGATIGVATTIGTILNDDAEPPVLAVAGSTGALAEGNGGAKPFTFIVTRSGDTRAAVAARWRVMAGDTIAHDFTGGVLPTGLVSLAAGETSTTFSVPVQGDSQVERDEAFSVTLSSPTGGAAIGNGTASGTILNDDAEPPVLAVAAVDAVKAEGQGGTTPFTFVITRTGNLGQAIRVGWRTLGNSMSPAAANDFAGGRMPTGSVSLGVGETRKMVIVRVASDPRHEHAEGFAVALINPRPSMALRPATAYGTILNDDR